MQVFPHDLDLSLLSAPVSLVPAQQNMLTWAFHTTYTGWYCKAISDAERHERSAGAIFDAERHERSARADDVQL